MQAFQDQKLCWIPVDKGETGDIELPDDLYFDLVRAYSMLREVNDQIDCWREDGANLEEYLDESNEKENEQ